MGVPERTGRILREKSSIVVSSSYQHQYSWLFTCSKSFNTKKVSLLGPAPCVPPPPHLTDEETESHSELPKFMFEKFWSSSSVSLVF